MKIYPKQHQQRRPPQKFGTFIGTLEYQQKHAGQQQSKHLRTNAPTGTRCERAQQRHYPGDIRAPRTPQENQKKSGGNNQAESDDQPTPSCQPVQTKDQDLGQPLMINPWLPKPREGIRVGVEDGVRLNNKLSSAQMPPQVRIGCAARRHGEKTHRKNDYEYATRL